MSFRASVFVPVLASLAIAFQNPVLPGDHPDPSLIRVGNEYWAANTSSEWAPIFPLFSSRDLRSWSARGAVFTDPPAWAAADFWAPELTVDRGSVRVYYAARKRNGPLCVAVATATRPSGPYTDRGTMVCDEDGSIDPFFIRDRQGQPYLVWKEDGNSRNVPSIIWAQRTSDDGLGLQDTRHELIRSEVPWEGKVVEGGDILRHGEFFYLFYAGGACCGRRCNYGVGVARAKDLLGPWEKDPANPIATENQDWTCPGHGTIAQGPDGNDYLLYHAYSRRGRIFTGREAILDRITWRDGWPSINGGHGPSSESHGEPAAVRDEFSSTALDPGWQWPLHDRPRVKLGRGRLLLAPPASHVNDFPGAVLARSLASLDYAGQAWIISNSVRPGQSAGLAIVGDLRNAAGIALRDGRIVQWRIDKGKWAQLSVAGVPEGRIIRLRIQARGATKFRTWYSAETGEWKEAGKLVDVSALPPWDRGLRVALTAAGPGGAQFTGFALRYGTSE